MKPWIKLYRDESGNFGMLPFMVRAVFTELLKFADDEGRIATGAMDHVSALCLRCSVHPKERRGFKSKLTVLLDDGCIRFEKGAVVFPAWERFQSDPKVRKGRSNPRSSDTDATLTEHSDDTDGALTEHCDDTDATLTRHSKLVKPPESLNTGPGDKDRDKEEDRDLDKIPPQTPPKPKTEGGGREVRGPEIYDLLRELWPGSYPGPIQCSATDSHRLNIEINGRGGDEVKAEVAAFCEHVKRERMKVRRPIGLFLAGVGGWATQVAEPKRQRGWAAAAPEDAFDDSEDLDEIFKVEVKQEEVA